MKSFPSHKIKSTVTTDCMPTCKDWQVRFKKNRFQPSPDQILFESSTAFVKTHHSLFPKVNAHRCDKLGIELAICILVKKAGLSYSRITERQEFYEVIIVPIRHSENSGHTFKSKTKRISQSTTLPRLLLTNV